MIRFWSVVVVPTIATVVLTLPIVIPVAEFAPIEIVPVASIMLFASPVMLVPLKVSAAAAIWIPAKATKAIAVAMPPP
jgi:hypothetical protein